MIRKILVLVPDYLGERQKIDTLADVIAAEYGAEIAHGVLNDTNVTFRRRVARFLLYMPFVPYIIKSQSFFQWMYFRLAFEASGLPANFKPDLVITSQAKRLLSGATLSVLYDAKWLFIGLPKHVSRWAPHLTATITVSSDQSDVENITKSLQHPLIISLDVTPTRMRRLRSRAQTSDKAEGQKWVAVFVGGDTRGQGKRYHYDDAAWDRFTQVLRDIADNSAMRFMLSTSPRTGARGEEKIEAFLSEDEITNKVVRAVFYGKEPEDVVSDFLNKADFAIVTEDSRSMISDCIAAGVPVFIFRLSADVAKSQHRAYFDGLRDRGLVEYIEPGAGLDKQFIDRLKAFKPLQTCWSQTFLKAIKPALDQ